jgi:hypothetical protein
MYIGHVGAALAAKRWRVAIGLLPLLVATYAPDWVDTGMCVAGKYDARGMLSHSVPAVLVLALIGFALYAGVTRDWTGAAVIAAVVLSHMVLDWITGYKPTWPGGPFIGLRLYDRPIADFVAEGAVITMGTLLYARTVSTRRRPWQIVAVMLGALIALQMTIDVAHLLMKNLPKC